MKLLILTSRFPYPIEKGDKLRIYHQIRHLSQEHEICLVSMSDQEVNEEDRAHLSEYCSEIHLFPISKISTIWSLIKAAFSSQPFQVHYFYRKGVHKKILKIAEAFRPDRLYCQLIRMVPYVEGISTSKTLDYMDCFSIGMERRADVSEGLKKILFRWEAHKLAHYEDKAFTFFNSHSIISEQDKSLLPSPHAKKVEVVPNGVDTEYFEKQLDIHPEYEFVFVGNMGYAPNVVAARYLALRVLPEIRKTRTEAKLLLAGARPGKDVLALAKEPGVTVGGWYEDIRKAYASGRVFVAPLFSGSGQQNKILEAMAMEIPCITTSLVNNAIQAKENEEIMLAEDLESFVNQCLLVLDYPTDADLMGTNGRAFVQSNYSWEKSMGLLENLFTRSVSISR